MTKSIDVKRDEDWYATWSRTGEVVFCFGVNGVEYKYEARMTPEIAMDVANKLTEMAGTAEYFANEDDDDSDEIPF